MHFKQRPGDSGWLDDRASTSTAYRAAMQFVGKTDADAETVFRCLVCDYVPIRHRIETGRESQRREEAELRAHDPEVSGSEASEDAG